MDVHHVEEVGGELLIERAVFAPDPSTETFSLANVGVDFDYSASADVEFTAGKFGWGRDEEDCLVLLPFSGGCSEKSRCGQGGFAGFVADCDAELLHGVALRGCGWRKVSSMRIDQSGDTYRWICCQLP